MPLPIQKYAFTFTDDAAITIPGAVHGLGTADLDVVLWETLAGSTRRLFVPGRVEVDDLTLDVTITLGNATTGRGVLFG